MSDLHPPEHPNGPRTFANVLRDNTPLPPGVLERLNALEGGRHPTLSAIREALGLEMQLLTPEIFAATRAVWPKDVAAASDEELARIIDAMHRVAAGPRRIAVEVTPDGPQLTRTNEAIRIRDDEPLVFLVFVDNPTGSGVTFSTEAHGEGMGGYIEPHRAGSGLFDAGHMHAGSYLLPVMTVADGRPATVDVPVECAPSGVLHVKIIDEETGEPVAARVYLRDGVGASFPAGATPRRDVHGNGFFHADGSFASRTSGKARLRVVRGIEYEPHEMDVVVPADGEVEHIVSLRRWSHMAADGWYSGDVHVHMHYGGEYLLEPDDVMLAQRAEDVHFLNMMVANQGSGWIHDREQFSGDDHELSDGNHILRWGEEYRNDFYGHMCMFGINELVPPFFGGLRYSENPSDVPANADAARHCHDVGGTLSYAHPMFDSGDLDRVFGPAHWRSVEAKELPVDAALGLIDAVDVLSYPGHQAETQALWYRLLNCGLRLAATAGTDTFMNTADQVQFSNPPGGDRVFVRVDGGFTTQSWCDGVRRARTFATNGPMLSLEVRNGDRTFGIGDEIEATAGDVITIETSAGSYVPIETLELVVNGVVVASAKADEGGRSAALTHDLRIAGSCWFAVRASGPGHELVLDSTRTPSGALAHTSPVYVTVGKIAVGEPDDAAYFVEWIDRLIALAAERGRYASAEEREHVAETFRNGRAYYEKIAGSA